MRSVLTAAVIALGSVAFATSVSAQHWGEHRDGGWDHRGGDFREHRGFEGRRFEGERFEGRRFEEGRHFWHGRWYNPGVGSCWRWSPVGWVWICD